MHVQYRTTDFQLESTYSIWNPHFAPHTPELPDFLLTSMRVTISLYGSFLSLSPHFSSLLFSTFSFVFLLECGFVF
jgi:hypothetical protein